MEYEDLLAFGIQKPVVKKSDNWWQVWTNGSYHTHGNWRSAFYCANHIGRNRIMFALSVRWESR